MAMTVSPATLETLGLSSPPDQIRQFVDPHAATHHCRTDIEAPFRMQRVQRELLEHPFYGGMADLFVQAKALEYLTLQLSALEALVLPRSTEIKRKSRFQEARDRLVADVMNPPSIDDLARTLILTDDLPLKEIAWRAGYRHFSNFVTAFKRRFGITPARMREA